MPVISASVRRRRIILAAAVLAAAVLAAVLALTGGGDQEEKASSTPRSTSTDGSPDPEGDYADLARREANDPFAIGRADAPVVLIEYADFQCPFCGQFAQKTQPELVRDYVEQGKLRIEWRNFPIFGAESEQAARAAWAAGQQKRFWEFHDLLYAAEPRKRNSGAFSEERLVEFARQAEVPDLKRFREDMAGDKAHQAVDRDQEEGYGLGVPSTPAFLVGDTPILGAQPTKTFRDAVEKAHR
ncbi:DsbA family protein [Streptomyces sp. TP-A0874]|uniref:DsbA family protein n=1 Tax=Streptomyces sp. TP-A0874 TaxID=549819 RepID=UPI000852A68D|nr:thioredoxin domain-containing protein [Streptomyces sp. TP-A0874]